MGRILLVEDEEHSVRALERYLEEAGHRLATAARAVEALERALDLEPEVLVTDLFLADHEGGATVARKLTARDPSLQVIVMTGLFTDDEPTDEVEVEGFLVKPFSLGVLAHAVHRALRNG